MLRTYGGAGLGLAVVYGFMRQSGGDARIISSPENGTTVELLFSA
ncbi:ATP-binding protein [Rhizobium sp. Root1212]